jgi:alpha-N-arabinofuranosidase
MLKAGLILDKDFRIGEVAPSLFGGFAEHLGRCVYEGIYEPDHPAADEDGFRTDVLELVRELGMPVMRYPGGNFVSGYNWQDGVGPREQRPRRLDLAWGSLETNQFGTNEFIAWCRKAGTLPMLAVNLGTRGPDEARNLVEYCNHPAGTAWSDLRRQHGFSQPHGVKLWCLGNEVYGHWQMGHKSAEQYGDVAREAAKLMKWTDPSVELVLCGADQAWNARVLEAAYDHVDYLAIHQYIGSPDEGAAGYLARTDAMGEFIEATVATCDHVAAKLGKKRRMMIAFDEWNVWGTAHEPHTGGGDWPTAPPLQQPTYTMEDALAFGGMLLDLINHADRVKIGCLAQVVNVIAPIMTRKSGPAWRQTIFHPFAQASRFGRGIALRPVVESPSYDTKERAGVPYLKTACVLEPESGALTIFALNRSLEEPLELSADLRAFGRLACEQCLILRHQNLKKTNTELAPDRVKPTQNQHAVVENRRLVAALPPASWNVIRLAPRE